MRAGAAIFCMSLWLAASAAQAATQVDALSVLPNPATVHASGPAQVEMTVEVNRGQFDRQACDVLIETGDGSPPIRLSFARGDEQRKTVRYAFTTPGSYTVRAVAAYGCSGTRTVNVAVYGSGYPAAAAAAAPAAPAGPAMTPEVAPAGGCPAGWYVVPESVQGSRYRCRPNLPSIPLQCAAGTSYFADNGVIGCR